MTQQQISTTSVTDPPSGGIGDSVILANSSHPTISSVAGDPWETVLADLSALALDPTQIVPAMGAANSPSTSNPFVTSSTMILDTQGRKSFIVVGPSSSVADFTGSDQTPFAAAIALLQTRSSAGGWIVVLPGTYAFTATLNVPDGFRIEGEHPLTTIIQSSGNFAAVNLQGDSCSLDKVQIQAPSSTSSAALLITGSRCLVERSLIANFSFAGISFVSGSTKGSKARILSTRFDSSSAGAPAILLQNYANTVSHCSFTNLLPGGAVRVEGSDCGVFSSYFAAANTGYAYNILSTSVNNTRIVGNHFASSASLALATDYGTGSIRYANTPNTLAVNENDFVEPLAGYTGQTSLTDSSVTLVSPQTDVLGYPFSITPASQHDLTTIDSALDLFVQRNYEERNYFLNSSDPTFAANGSPTSGVFSWDGSVLTNPAFNIQSVFNRQANWTVAAASSTLTAGEVLYVTIDQTLSNTNIALSLQVAPYPLLLDSPSTSQFLVLAVCFTGGKAVWLQGFRLLTNLTSFDVDGSPLPIVRYIGFSESRNPASPDSLFCAPANASLTTKLGAQSSALKLLFERTNLSVQNISSDASFSTDPTPGSWLSASALTNGIAATPTHLLSLRTQTYGLLPTAGLYKYNLSLQSWSLISGCPLAGPFTALAPMLTGIAVLSTAGQIAYYDPDTALWLTYSPVLSTQASALAPFASSRGASFQTGGHADYSVQTTNRSFFTTLDGYTLRYCMATNSLDMVPRAFTEDTASYGLLGSGSKDTGFNCLRDPESQFESLDNGLSYSTALPVGTKGTFVALNDSYYSEFKATDFSSLVPENFSYDPSSGSWIGVYKNASATKTYIMGGGKSVSYLLAVLANSDPLLSGFTPFLWVVNAQKLEVFALGATTAKAFSTLRGYINPATNAWIWVAQTPGAANTCQGLLACYDYTPAGPSAGDLWVLASNPSRGNLPSMWKRDGLTGNWTYVTLNSAPSLPEDVSVPAATSGCFNYVAGSNQGGYGAASPYGIGFLICDTARSARPTLFEFNRVSLAYAGVRLADSGGDVTLASATANSAGQFYGAAFQVASNSVLYCVRSTTGVTQLYGQHQDLGTLTKWSEVTLSSSSGALTLPFTYRSGNQLSVDNANNGYNPTAASYAAYLSTNDGTSSVTLTGTSTGFSGVSYSTSGKIVSGIAPFSFTNSSPFEAAVGAFRGGEPSVLIGSFVAPSTFATQGSGFGLDPGLGGGIFWNQPGTKVKNLGSGLWAGINRGGYLWIANANLGTNQIELTPNGATIRGDITVANLGTITDFDFAFSADGTQIAFVFADGGNSNKLGFILYTIATQAVVYERGGIAPLNPAGTNPCGSTPRITLNSFASSYDIVFEDDSRLGGQTSFFRRPLTTNAWSSEILGPSSDPNSNKTLSSMVANAGKSPSKPYVASNGDVVVASQKGTGNLLVFYRRASDSVWFTSTPTPLLTGGFVAPELAVSGSTLWVFGNNDGTTANVASSPSYTAGAWALTTVSTAYARCSAVKAYVFSDGIGVFSPLLGTGSIPANQEIGVFKFQNSGSQTAKVFSAIGRTQSAFLSGEEETSYGNHSWTSDGKILYGSTRPGRSVPSYTVRVSRCLWNNLGDSCLGSGRLLTIGSANFREEFADDPALNLINQFDSNHKFVQSWNSLPLAERDYGNFLALRYPYAADSSASSLFYAGNPATSVTADATLQTGQLQGAAAQKFPLVTGQTRIQGGAGASVLYHGAMAGLSCPPSTTNSAFFGSSTVGSSGLFKLNPQDSLTLNGTFTFTAPNDATRYYTLVGPMTFNLDASTLGHLVLDFPTASTVNLDSSANPLTYWTSLDHSITTYSLVLGELREKAFVLYPILKMGSRIVKLCLGSLEIPQITDDISLISYCAPVSQYGITKGISQKFYINPTAIDSVTVKFVGTIRGIQSLEFSVGGGQRNLLLAQGLPPLSQGYYYYVTGSSQIAAGQGDMRIEHIAGRLGNLVDFNL